MIVLDELLVWENLESACLVLGVIFGINVGFMLVESFSENHFSIVGNIFEKSKFVTITNVQEIDEEIGGGDDEID